MSVTVEAFRAAFLEFADVPDAAGMKGVEAGVVNSQSASTSSLSVTNANNGMVTGTDPFQADYARTSYGLELLSLLELIMPHGYVVK